MRVMDEENHPSFQQERFVREFIAIYKENRLLWDKTHPDHKKREERARSLESLLIKCREYYPEADPDFVIHKINTMRTCFRRQYKQVLESRRVTECSNGVYKPGLWYYNLLLFTVGEKPEENCENKSSFFQKVSCWTREYTVLLIDLFKNHPVLHSSTGQENNKSKRQAALQTITNNLTTLTGKKFRYEDVKKKLLMLKGQYRKYYLQLHTTKNKRFFQKLWCYDLMDEFLKDHVSLLHRSKRKNRGVKKVALDSDSDLDNHNIYKNIKEEDIDLCESMGNDLESDNVLEDTNNSKEYDDYDDIFDTIGRNVAHKLSDMTTEQSDYCKKILSNLLYNGLLENVSCRTKLEL